MRVSKTDAVVAAICSMACSALTYHVTGSLMHAGGPVVALVALRYALGTCVLWGLVRTLHEGLNWQFLKSRALHLSILGFIMSLVATSFFVAFKYTNSVDAGLISLLNPVVMILLGRVFLAEEVSVRRWIGMAVALAGGVYVISGGHLAGGNVDAARVTGNLLMAFSTSGFAVVSVLTKKWLADANPLSVSTAVDTYGFGIAAVASLFFLPEYPQIPLTQHFWMTMLVVGVVGIALQNVGWNIAVLKLGAAKSAMVRTLLPVFVVLLALISGRTVSTEQWIALVVTVGGAVIAMWPEKSAPVDEAPAATAFDET